MANKRFVSIEYTEQFGELNKYLFLKTATILNLALFCENLNFYCKHILVLKKGIFFCVSNNGQ